MLNLNEVFSVVSLISVAVDFLKKRSLAAKGSICLASMGM